MGLMLSSGCLMGMILDLYRILSRRFRFKGWVVSLVDLLYWTVAAGLVFSLLMWSNWGELRFYIFVAILAGWAIYHRWLSAKVSRGIEWGMGMVERTLQLILRVLQMMIWMPILAIWNLLMNILSRILSLLRLILRLPLWMLAPAGRWLKRVGGRLFRPVVNILRRIRNWFP